MHQALLKPLVFGVNLSEQLSNERKFTELDLLEDFISQTFVVVHQLLRIQRSQAQAHPLAATSSASSSGVGVTNGRSSPTNGSDGGSPGRKRKGEAWDSSSTRGHIDDITHDATEHFTRLGFGANKRASPTPLPTTTTTRDGLDLADMDGSAGEGIAASTRGLPPQPSFHQILLDSSYSPNSAGASAEHPPSLVQSIAQYANYSRSTQLQILAVQTVTFLCTPAPECSHSLAGYLGPSGMFARLLF
jgi:hypothetical protein